jgi:ADP-ribose pyrophosphatase
MNAMPQDLPYETLSSELHFHGRAFDVRRDQIRLPDGTITSLDIIDHIGAVTIVPVDHQDRLWLVRQYRHAAARMLLELPAGALHPGEPPEACAQREMREETGMAAGRLVKIGEFFLAPGYSTEYMLVYLATDLRPDPLPSDLDEFLSVETVGFPHAFELIAQGEIQDAKSLVGLFLARPYLENLSA